MLFAGLGGLLILIGTIWLIVLAVQTGANTGEKVLWALVNFFCQPVGGVIFFIVKKVGLIPLILVVVGCLIGGFGYYSMIDEMMRTMPR